jgi:DNA-binding CsgD family transcriptional regulator/uncharacterized protein YciI
MTYVIDRTLSDNVELIRRARDAHGNYWRPFAESGVLIGASPWKNGCGEVLILEGIDEASLQRILSADPYAQTGIVLQTRAQEWDVFFGQITLAGADLAMTVAPATAAVDRRPRIAFDPPRPRSPRSTAAALTPHEQRIASMMLEGMTNQKIAERLSVSSRAVEQHITRTYRKLCISRRAQLGTALRGIQAGPAPAQIRQLASV